MCPAPLTKDEEDIILKEIGYNRAQLQRDIPMLRLWLQEQPHLPPCRLKESDIFLSNFLVGCKGSIEKAKQKLDHYYSLRGKGDLFTKRNPESCVKLVKDVDATVELPKRTSDLCGITLSTLLVEQVDSYPGLEMLRYGLLLFEHKLRTGGIYGQETYILDGNMFTISHFMKLPPTALRAFLSFFQDAYPIRVKKILLANVPSVLATAINTVLVPFMSKKIKERFSISSEPVESLFEEIELLPSNYKGGKQKSLKDLAEEWADKLGALESIASQFEEEVDESKRPQLKNGISDPYFGLHGSIKALVLD